MESDKAHRESKSQREQLEKLQRLQENERAAFESATKELSDRLNAAVIGREEEVGRRHEIQELNKDYRSNIDKLRTQVNYYEFCSASVAALLYSLPCHLRYSWTPVRHKWAN